MTLNQIDNVREMPITKKTTARKIWENMQYFNLALTIAGQLLVAELYLIAQGIWTFANVIALVRDFVLKRPAADIVRDTGMLALSVSLVTLRILGIY